MSKSLTIREMHIKTTTECHHTPISTTEMKKVITPDAGEDTGKMDHLYIAARNVKWYNHSAKQFGKILQN